MGLRSCDCMARSARRPRERATADDVQMKMEDALPSPRAAVHGDTKIAATVGAGDLRRDAMQTADQRVVFRFQIRKSRDVLPRDH